MQEETLARAQFVRAGMRVLVRSAEITKIVDFADMCWLPVVRGVRVWAYDVVFVDETQDLSPSQIELLMKCVRRGGRVIVVGDDRQAIFAFRGADENTIPNLITRLRAKVLPLSVTYRCAKSIAQLAATEVPDFTAAPNAPEGNVSPATLSQLVADARSPCRPEPRANAPLVGLCLKLLAKGTRARVLGRDVGKGLITLIERMRKPTVIELIKALKVWHGREVLRLEAADRATDSADDMYACVVALSEGLTATSALVERCRNLFAAEPTGNEETEEEKAALANLWATTVTLGTTHKLKGLEADRVWMLADTYRRQRGGEEANCWYVACSRAKSDLRLVSSK